MANINYFAKSVSKITLKDFFKGAAISEERQAEIIRDISTALYPNNSGFLAGHLKSRDYDVFFSSKDNGTVGRAASSQARCKALLDALNEDEISELKTTSAYANLAFMAASTYGSEGRKLDRDFIMSLDNVSGLPRFMKDASVYLNRGKVVFAYTDAVSGESFDNQTVTKILDAHKDIDVHDAESLKYLVKDMSRMYGATSDSNKKDIAKVSSKSNEVELNANVPTVVEDVHLTTLSGMHIDAYAYSNGSTSIKLGDGLHEYTLGVRNGLACVARDRETVWQDVTNGEAADIADGMTSDAIKDMVKGVVGKDSILYKKFDKLSKLVAADKVVSNDCTIAEATYMDDATADKYNVSFNFCDRNALRVTQTKMYNGEYKSWFAKRAYVKFDNEGRFAVSGKYADSMNLDTIEDAIKASADSLKSQILDSPYADIYKDSVLYKVLDTYAPDAPATTLDSYSTDGLEDTIAIPMKSMHVQVQYGDTNKFDAAVTQLQNEGYSIGYMAEADNVVIRASDTAAAGCRYEIKGTPEGLDKLSDLLDERIDESHYDIETESAAEAAEALGAMI